jgi:hypothetical protein
MDRLPAEPRRHLTQERADAGRPFIGHRRKIGGVKREFLVLGADPPVRLGFIASLEMGDELIAAFNRPVLGVLIACEHG